MKGVDVADKLGGCVAAQRGREARIDAERYAAGIIRIGIGEGYRDQSVVGVDSAQTQRSRAVCEILPVASEHMFGQAATTARGTRCWRGSRCAGLGRSRCWCR